MYGLSPHPTRLILHCLSQPAAYFSVDPVVAMPQLHIVPLHFHAKPGRDAGVCHGLVNDSRRQKRPCVEAAIKNTPTCLVGFFRTKPDPFRPTYAVALA